ncbi:vanillate O-demethylase monooxygenase subunit [Kutzneria buriramensis]|uniref:Vanillate O-demethylase monooxygenase subunit n=1 Tax=Kutzneria buriramensis TaxID=1045776 RepID=A0A3E0HMD2_9PSEU|nr:vanillate O-demethylase monooxygenase subunit [Kutzneria buriramensis]
MTVTRPPPYEWRVYPKSFPRNQWYVAGHAQDFGRTLLSRWILGDPICFYRRVDGTPVALTDRCVHRQMPLTLGKLTGDSVECGYHGIVYGPDGQATKVPSQNPVPPNCRVHRYPVRDRGGLLWIWLGDPDKADESMIPVHPWLDSPDWAIVRGTLHMNARAQLLNENLLDLTHVSFLHADSIGTNEVAETPATTEVRGDTVFVTRPMPSVLCPPLFEKVMGLSGMIDRESVAEYTAPGFHISHVLAKPAGAASDDPRACRHKAVHCVTPETETSAHYFWLIARDYHVDDEAVSQIWQEGTPGVLMQDVDAVEAIERVIAPYEPDYPFEINLRADNGALRARRIIERMIAAEQAG